MYGSYMRMRISAFAARGVLTAVGLAALTTGANGQEVTFEKRTEIGRARLQAVTRTHSATGTEKWLLSWKTPMTLGDRFEVMQERSAFPDVWRYQWTFQGVEGGSLRLLHKAGSFEKGKRGSQHDEPDMIFMVPAAEGGAYVYYPTSTVDLEVGFRITPNAPKPGLYTVELLMPDLRPQR